MIDLKVYEYSVKQQAVACDEPPAEGQFVAIWFYDGRIHAQTLRYGANNKLQQYSEDIDNWYDTDQGLWMTKYPHTFFKLV